MPSSAKAAGAANASTAAASWSESTPIVDQLSAPSSPRHEMTRSVGIAYIVVNDARAFTETPSPEFCMSTIGVLPPR